MAHYSDNTHSTGDVSTTATPPQKKAPSLRTRIAVIAVVVVLFAVIGVIALVLLVRILRAARIDKE